jgi:uncharacterized protein (DUF2267 family)
MADTHRDAESHPDHRRTRHAAHVIQTSHKAASLVRDMTGLSEVDSALAALQVVAGGIVRRLTPPEAYDFVAQLPSELREPLLDLPAGPDENITLETIHAELADCLSLPIERAAELAPGIGVAIRRMLSSGELNDVLAQLPRDLWPLLPDEVAHQTP